MTNYKTKDLKLAAYLWTQLTYQVGFKGLIPVPSKPNVFWFNIEIDCSADQLDEMINEYSNDRTCVEPNSYNTKIRRLLEALSEVSTK